MEITSLSTTLSKSHHPVDSSNSSQQFTCIHEKSPAQIESFSFEYDITLGITNTELVELAQKAIDADVKLLYEHAHKQMPTAHSPIVFLKHTLSPEEDRTHYLYMQESTNYEGKFDILAGQLKRKKSESLKKRILSCVLAATGTGGTATVVACAVGAAPVAVPIGLCIAGATVLTVKHLQTVQHDMAAIEANNCSACRQRTEREMGNYIVQEMHRRGILPVHGFIVHQ